MLFYIFFLVGAFICLDCLDEHIYVQIVLTNIFPDCPDEYKFRLPWRIYIQIALTNILSNCPDEYLFRLPRRIYIQLALTNICSDCPNKYISRLPWQTYVQIALTNLCSDCPDEPMFRFPWRIYVQIALTNLCSDCPDEWLVWEGNCYFFMPQPQTWQEAVDTCSRLGKHSVKRNWDWVFITNYNFLIIISLQLDVVKFLTFRIWILLSNKIQSLKYMYKVYDIGFQT